MNPRYSMHLEMAVKCLRQGGVIAYPTESVWGLGCDPFNAHAIERILELKKRPWQKGLIVLSGQKEHFAPVLDHLEPSLQQRFLAPVERPTTWLVPDEAGYFSSSVKGTHSFVAMRLTAHPLVSAMTAALGMPLISTSANPAGRPTARSACMARRYFGNELDYLLPGSTQHGAKPSVIKNLLTGAVLRA